MSRETIENHWNEILEVINSVEARGELVVLIGDFNRNLGISPDKEDNPSHGGSLVNEFVESGKYVLLNNSQKVVGGPWTRVNPADKENKSILDLVIISEEFGK